MLFLCNRGANGIDGLISSGIGAAEASGRPTTIVTGELGFLHDLGGLAALRDVSTPVRIVVIDNGGGGIFHFLPQKSALEAEEFEPLFGTPRAVSVEKAAALFDLPYTRLESLDDLPTALAAGTGLIEVRTDRQTNVAAHRRITDRVLAAIAAATLARLQARTRQRRRSRAVPRAPRAGGAWSSVRRRVQVTMTGERRRQHGPKPDPRSSLHCETGVTGEPEGSLRCSADVRLRRTVVRDRADEASEVASPTAVVESCRRGGGRDRSDGLEEVVEPNPDADPRHRGSTQLCPGRMGPSTLFGTRPS